jgi:O-antigen/teichoic acid export membrane protein
MDLLASSREPTGPSADAGLLAIRGGAVRVVGFIAGVIVSLGAATILVRHLGIPDFGRYVTVTSLIGLVGGVTEAGIVVYGIREFATRTGSARNEVMADLLAARMALTIVGVACAVFFAGAVGYSGVLVVGTALAGIGLLLQVVTDLLSVPLQATLQLGRLTVVDLVRRALAVLFIAGLAALGSKLLPFLGVPILSGGIALLMVARLVRPHLTIWLRVDPRAWRALLADAFPFAIAASIGALYFYITVIVMSLIANPVQTGLFATAFRVTQVILGVPTLLLTAVFPLISRSHAVADVLDGIMAKVMAVATICGVWLSICIALGSGVIIGVIAGHKGHAATSVLRIQGIVLAVSFISSASAIGLLSLRRYRPLLVTSTLALLVNVLLAIVLIPVLGARGGAVADVLTETAVAIGLSVSLGQALPRLRPAPPFLLLVGLACSLSLAVWLIPVGEVIRVIAATVLYFGILLRAGVIPQELIRALPGARRLSLLH